MRDSRWHARRQTDARELVQLRQPNGQHAIGEGVAEQYGVDATVAEKKVGVECVAHLVPRLMQPVLPSEMPRPLVAQRRPLLEDDPVWPRGHIVRQHEQRLALDGEASPRSSEASKRGLVARASVPLASSAIAKPRERGDSAATAWLVGAQTTSQSTPAAIKPCSNGAILFSVRCVIETTGDAGHVGSTVLF